MKHRSICFTLFVIALFVFTGSVPPRAYATDAGAARLLPPFPYKVQVRAAGVYGSDMLYDPLHNKLYVTNTNSIVPYDLAAGKQEPPIQLPLQTNAAPNPMALSDDGNTLYVADVVGAVQRVNLQTRTPDIQIVLGQKDYCVYTATDMVVLKGKPGSVVIASGCQASPSHASVTVYDDGVARPNSIASGAISKAIELSANADTIYGLDNQTTGLPFQVLKLTDDGIRVASETTGLTKLFGTDMVFANGLIYTTNGQIIDPAAMKVVHTYPIDGLVAPDVKDGKVYFLSYTFLDQGLFPFPALVIYDLNGSDPTATLLIANLPPYHVTRFIKTGPATFAVLTADGLYFIDLTPSYNTFLPALSREDCFCSGIHGTVRYMGEPTSGVQLKLRFYNGSSWSTQDTTFTSPKGKFDFPIAPSLAAGQKYYVLFDDGQPNLIGVWGTRELTSYRAGSSVKIGEFDIGPIDLVSPSGASYVTLPATFTWSFARRPATPGDSYEFDLFDAQDGDPYFYTAPLGHTDHYTLNSLPRGFTYDYNGYAWTVFVYDQDGGYGASYYADFVHFVTNPYSLPSFGPWLANPSGLKQRLLESMERSRSRMQP